MNTINLSDFFIFVAETIGSLENLLESLQRIKRSQELLGIVTDGASDEGRCGGRLPVFHMFVRYTLVGHGCRAVFAYPNLEISVHISVMEEKHGIVCRPSDVGH